MSGYNGYKNYETWCVNLWLDNEPSTQNDMVELAKQYRGRGPYELARAIKNYIKERKPEATEWGLFDDLLGAALSEVDWYELADYWLKGP